jgi:PhnB protein
MAINAYLNFQGNTREVVEYYAKVFGVESPQIMSFGDSPQNPDYPIAEEAKDLVLHARFTAFGSELMFSDVFPGMPFTQGNNITLAIGSTDVDQLKDVFHKLKEGGKVTMELQETFWSKCYGQLVDKFGIGWMFSHDNGEMTM